MKPSILLYGFGGHGAVLAEGLYASGFEYIGVFDDREIVSNVDYIKYLGPYDAALHPDCKIIIAIGNNEIRSKLGDRIQHGFYTYIHPSAVLAASVKIGAGSVILQQAVLQTNVQTGKHCIINAGAVIDHDCNLGDAVHVSPLAYIGSNSQIASGVLVETGQVVPRLSVL